MFDQLIAAIENVEVSTPVGRVSGVGAGLLHISGLLQAARIGDRVEVLNGTARGLCGEVIKLSATYIDVLAEGSVEGVSIGDRLRLMPPPKFAPSDNWIGRVIDPDGRPLDGLPMLPGVSAANLQAPPPAAHSRRALGPRLSTGLAVFDTLLPLAAGQRIGLFAGSGVGKSTLLAQLARAVEADVIVIGLVGERGRELRDFVEDVLGVEGMKRSVVVAATSDQAPQVRRRCAWSATAVAEHFRDDGRQVLLLLDSITRFAEAHREVALAAGEGANLRGFPASTGPAIAALCERAGPGSGEAGDITAVFSVLVAGSDMEEPVADMLRGVLDGHVVLDREIAERGRFPAVDLLRSVSRSLPNAASPGENTLISAARSQLGTYDRAELMVQSGLYAAGSDPRIDEAIGCQPGLEKFLALQHAHGVGESFRQLRLALPATLNESATQAAAQMAQMEEIPPAAEESERPAG